MISETMEERITVVQARCNDGVYEKSSEGLPEMMVGQWNCRWTWRRGCALLVWRGIIEESKTPP